MGRRKSDARYMAGNVTRDSGTHGMCAHRNSKHLAWRGSDRALRYSKRAKKKD